MLVLGRRRNPRARISRTLTIRLAGAVLATAGIAVIGVGTINTPLFSGKVHLVDSNNGDIWFDTVTADDTTQSGHETDPHLPCDQDINLWGNGLKDATGTYTIYSIPPSDVDHAGESAGDDQDWPTSGSGTWTYGTDSGGNQIISGPIDVKTLIKNAIHNGDVAQPEQGYHFKIDFEQDPSKAKTFWVDCSPAPTVTTTVGEPTTTTTTTTTTATNNQTIAAPTTVFLPTTLTVTAGLPAAASSSATPSSGVAGATTPSTPSTGLDVAFGVGIALLVSGGALVITAPRHGRRNSK